MGDADTALLLFLEVDIRRFLINADTESFEFCFDDPLVCERLVHVENDEDQIAGLGDSNNLPTTTFTVLSTLNNTWQI